jgi:hypothetical protein
MDSAGSKWTGVDLQAIGAGTDAIPLRFSSEERMPEHPSILIETSVQIAWNYLELTGELGNAAIASRFLADHIELMIRPGESGGVYSCPIGPSTSTGASDAIIRRLPEQSMGERDT